MYKVFRDNKEIRFVSLPIKKSVKGFVTVYLSDFASTKEFFIYIDSLDKGSRVRVACEDVETAFKKVFYRFTKISAAGGIVQRKKSILVIHRLGKWDLPKGKIEKGEIPELAAYREIEEECGVHGHVLFEKIGETYHTYSMGDKHVLKRNYWFYFLYRGEKKLVAQTEEDITEAVWMKKDDLSKLKSNTYPSILAVLKSWQKKFG